MSKAVLQRLVAAKYLLPLKTAPAASGKFRLAEHGLMLLQNLQEKALADLQDEEGLRSSCHYVGFKPRVSRNLHLPKSREQCLAHIEKDEKLLEEIKANTEAELVAQVAFSDDRSMPSKNQPTVNFKGGSVQLLKTGTPSVIKVYSFFSEHEWKYRYLDVLRERRRFWKRLLATPWNIQVHISISLV